MSSYPQSFDPIRSYDKPDVFLTQLFEGEASFDSLRRTLLSPDELTLEERNSFTQDIKDALGNHEVTDAMVDIATNPFVILSFLVTPPAGKAIASTGRLFTTQNWSRYLQNEGIFFKILHTLRLAPVSSQIHGTPAGPILQEAIANMEDLHRKEGILNDAMTKVLKTVEDKTGIKLNTLDPDAVKDPVKKQILKEIDYAMAIKMHRWDHSTVLRRADVTPHLKGQKRVEFISLENPALSRSFKPGETIDPNAWKETDLNLGTREVSRIYDKIQDRYKKINNLNKAKQEGLLTDQQYANKINQVIQVKTRGPQQAMGPRNVWREKLDDLWEAETPEYERILKARSEGSVEWEEANKALRRVENRVERKYEAAREPDWPTAEEASQTSFLMEDDLAAKAFKSHPFEFDPDQKRRIFFSPEHNGFFRTVDSYDEDLTRNVDRLGRIIPGEKRPIRAVIEEQTAPDMFNSPHQVQKLDEIVEKYGLDDYFSKMKQFREERLVALFGKDSLYEATGEYITDPDKLVRIGHAIAGAKAQGEAQGLLQVIDDVAGDLLSDDVLALIRKGKNLKNREAAFKNVQKALSDAFTGGLVRDSYVPRNVIRTVNKKMETLGAGDVYADKQMQEAFLAEAARGRKAFRATWDPDDLEEMAEIFGETPALKTMIRNNRSEMSSRAQATDRAVVFRVGHHNQWRRYAHRSAVTHTLHVKAPGRRVTAAIEDYITDDTIKARDKRAKSVRDTGWHRMRAGLQSATGTSFKYVGDKAFLVKEGRMPLGGMSLLDLLESSVRSIPDTRTQKLITEKVIPTITGRRHVSDIVNESVFGFTRGTINGLANSSLGRMLEKTGDQGKELVSQMKEWSSKTRLEDSAFDDVSGFVSRGLYSSHLGLNFGSIMLNMLQPITMGMPLMGVKATSLAYADAMRQMTKYAAARAKLGKGRITDAERDALMEEAFTDVIPIEGIPGGGVRQRFDELADINKSSFHMVDEASLRSGYKQPPGALKYWLLEGTMKPFEKAEWFNRLVMAHAAKHARLSKNQLNTLEDLGRMKDDATDLVQRTQFGSDPVNRPEIFYSEYLDNPLARQFLQFPLRQITGTLLNPGEMGGSALKHIIKAMGYSAIAYEVGKNVFDLDISRGLFTGSLLETVGGDRFFREQDPSGALVSNFLPPALDIVVNATQAIGSGDAELLGQTLPRMIPGGVAVSRVLGMAPDLPLPLGVQKQYADWSRMEGGQVPIYKEDGRLVGNMDGAATVLKALGADMKQFKEPQQISSFLLSNREQMRDYRRQWITAVLGNNIGEAEKVKAEFERRFKFPLTVSKSQMKNAIKLRERSVVSRIGETMERGAQGAYEGALPGNYFDRVPQPDVEAETARYIWSTIEQKNQPLPGESGIS